MKCRLFTGAAGALADESVDLNLSLDPPFNSKRDYNLLFKSPKGVASDAKIKAFEDTCHWNTQDERKFDELLHQPNARVLDTMRRVAPIPCDIHWEC